MTASAIPIGMRFGKRRHPADADGWYTEVRIPFSSIRYRPSESMTWGLQLYRYMHRRGEDTAWVTWDREKSGFVSRFGHAHRDDRRSRSPAAGDASVFVSRVTDPSVEGAVAEFERFRISARISSTE